jgi:hypothetical protein
MLVKNLLVLVAMIACIVAANFHTEPGYLLAGCCFAIVMNPPKLNRS